MDKEQCDNAIDGMIKYTDFLRARIDELENKVRELKYYNSVDNIKPLYWKDLPNGAMKADFDALSLRIDITKDCGDERYDEIILNVNDREIQCSNAKEAVAMANWIVKRIVEEALRGKGAF